MLTSHFEPNELTATIEQNAVAELPIVAESAPLTPIIEAACARVPPLWPLRNFVAVNPFLGLTSANFLQSSHLMRRVAHSDTVMPAAFYHECFVAGEIDIADLELALNHLKTQFAGRGELEWLQSQTPISLQAQLSSLVSNPRSLTTNSVLSFADFLDKEQGTKWGAFVVEEISKWCAAFYDRGQASWSMPWREESLFEAWKQAAKFDRNPEVAGVPAFRSLVNELPDDPFQLIGHALDIMEVPRADATDFLHRQLMSIAGWSGAVQFQVREKDMQGESDSALVELLAVRLAYDLALYAAFSEPLELKWRESLLSAVAFAEVPQDLLVLSVYQRALESAFQRDLTLRLKTANGEGTQTPSSLVRPQVQAIFCIDVRSELLRRSLESCGTDVETIGFAGFFGFAIEHIGLGHKHGSAQCPVLLTPKFRIPEIIPDVSSEASARILKQRRLSRQIERAWSDFKGSALSSFSFIETGGLLSGIYLAKNTLGVTAKKNGVGTLTVPDLRGVGDEPHRGISLEDQIATAHGALRGMSLLSNFGRLVLFCGHGSETNNNPYGSGLDCGACGGHTGESNARVAAAVFNNPAVREGLKAHGIFIPEDTFFLAGLHNTTSDHVTIFDMNAVPASHAADLSQLIVWLGEASNRTRIERAESLGLGGSSPQQIKASVFRKTKDWSEVRPEWGLAGNAAFIAAPRDRTRMLNLGGRTFLHNYDHHLDADSAILGLIMSAPMVVASWINLQYYASVVNNRAFGSGNKVTHNVVGKFAVVQGNGGDIQVGLPLQSLHDGSKWVHRPQRLSVYIEAPHQKISEVLNSNQGVRDLIENDWVHLFAIENEGRQILRYCFGGNWEQV